MTRFIDLTIPLASGVGHPMFRKVQIAPFHVHEIHRRSNADLFIEEVICDFLGFPKDQLAELTSTKK